MECELRHHNGRHINCYNFHNYASSGFSVRRLLEEKVPFLRCGALFLRNPPPPHSFLHRLRQGPVLRSHLFAGWKQAEPTSPSDRIKGTRLPHLRRHSHAGDGVCTGRNDRENRRPIRRSIRQCCAGGSGCSVGPHSGSASLCAGRSPKMDLPTTAALRLGGLAGHRNQSW